MTLRTVYTRDEYAKLGSGPCIAIIYYAAPMHIDAVLVDGVTDDDTSMQAAASSVVVATEDIVPMQASADGVVAQTLAVGVDIPDIAALAAKRSRAESPISADATPMLEAFEGPIAMPVSTDEQPIIDAVAPAIGAVVPP